jgi:SAM-dependent methyltransferase
MPLHRERRGALTDIRQIAICESRQISVPKSARILDFGCGAGQRVYQLIDAGYVEAIGYDVSEYLKLRDPGDRWRFHIHPSGNIPLPRLQRGLRLQ